MGPRFMPVVINAHGLPLAYSSASTYHFSATDAGLILAGSATHDSMWGDSSVTVTLSARAGDAIYHPYSTSTKALETPKQRVTNLTTCINSESPAQLEKQPVTED